MRRVLSILLATIVVACSGAAADTTTSTTSSTTTSTTTTIPTTTTTIYEVEVEGADAELAELITGLYSGEPVEAPEGVTDAFAVEDLDRPTEAVAHVADWDEETRLAVVEAGEDVTLAIADPDWRVVGGWWPSVGDLVALGEFPKLVVVAGSDARPGQDRERARTDSIHFVGMDAEGRAGIVGVPRDSWVPIPGAGRSKINAALSFGGPEMMMDTFVELTGLEFDGYLLTGFEGFENLIEILGGLEIDVPRNFNDRAAKAYLEAGRQILDASQALAMSRTRKTLPRGDFQRQEHGGLVMMAAQAMLAAQGPATLPSLLSAAAPHFSTDFTPEELLVLAATVTRVDPEQTVNVVAPGGTGSAGGASVVFLRDSVDELWEDLADGSLEAPED